MLSQQGDQEVMLGVLQARGWRQVQGDPRWVNCPEQAQAVRACLLCLFAAHALGLQACTRRR